MVKLENVLVVRGGVTLFENFHWAIADGEHWVVTGPNGSGKTVLLELLAGLLHAAHGSVTIDFVCGTSWDERFAERKRTIHYIPAHAIQTFLAGHEVFYQQRYYAIGDERVPLVKDILGDLVASIESLGLPGSFTIDALMHLPVTRLSNGQLKKVLILKNLAAGMPKLLLLDYPFEGLDSNSREDLAAFIDHLARTLGISVILADHDHHLPQVINRKLVLRDFRIASTEYVAPRPKESVPSTLPASTDASREPVVEMKGVTIRYGSREIISRLHWTIRRGERWALTGSNGSGKTTLFSLIYADHPMAYSEPVYLFGKRRGSGESIWDIKNRINYLGPELINYLQPKSITDTAGAYLRRSAPHGHLEALESAIRYFQMESFINLPLRWLSSGQLQMVLVIRSLLSGKELLLLDEPFQFLDPQQKARVTQYIAAHLHAETTLVLITHYDADIRQWTRERLHLT